MDDQNQQPQSTTASISLPTVSVTTSIENDSVPYNEGISRNDEYGGSSFFSNSVTYGINSSGINQGESEHPIQIDTSSVNTEKRPQVDYSIPNSYSFLYSSLPAQNAHTITFPASSNSSSIPTLKEMDTDSRSVLPYNNALVTGTKQSPYTRLPNKSAADCISSMDASFFINDNTATSQIPPCSDFVQQEEHKDDSYDHSDEDVKSIPSINTLQPPKRVRSAYNFFSRDFFTHNAINASSQGTLQNSAEQWKALSDEERRKFELMAEKDKERYKNDLELYSAKFQKYGFEPMLSKRDKQAFLYNCVNHEKARELACFLLLLNNDNIDITLAFVESVIQSLREPGVGAPIISADGQEEAPPRESKNELVFKCYEIGCGKEFRSLRNLVQHRLTHQVNRKKMFVCPYSNCGKSFLTASGLRKHRQSHEDHEQQYVCEMCKDTKVFKTKEGLNLHIKNKHLSQRRYTCTEPGCTKSFARKGDLQLHIYRVHTHERPFLCKVEGCGKTFTSMSELKRHQKTHGLYSLC